MCGCEVKMNALCRDAVKLLFKLKYMTEKISLYFYSQLKSILKKWQVCLSLRLNIDIYFSCWSQFKFHVQRRGSLILVAKYTL